MTELARWSLHDGGEILVEVAPDGPRVSPVSRGGDLIESASSTLGAALAHVRDAAAEALGQFRQMPVRPSAVELEFGIRLTAEAGAVIAKTAADGHLNIRLTWQAPNGTDQEGAAANPGETADQDGQA